MLHSYNTLKFYINNGVTNTEFTGNFFDYEYRIILVDDTLMFGFANKYTATYFNLSVNAFMELSYNDLYNLTVNKILYNSLPINNDSYELELV